MPAVYERLRESIHNNQLVAVATGLTGSVLGRKLLIWPTGEYEGTLGSTAVDRAVLDHAHTAFDRQHSQRVTLAEDVEIFIDVHVPPPHLVIVGAVHIAIPLVTFAKTLGFHTVVVDARTAFATQARFHHADALMIGWPADIIAEMNLNQSTYVVTLTHDEKLDTPALLVALNRPVRYIGALGSRRTHASRVEALKAEGASDEQIARIHAPIGLDLGGRRPEEIAVSIIAEIVTVMNGKQEIGY